MIFEGMLAFLSHIWEIKSYQALQQLLICITTSAAWYMCYIEKIEDLV